MVLAWCKRQAVLAAVGIVTGCGTCMLCILYYPIDKPALYRSICVLHALFFCPAFFEVPHILQTMVLDLSMDHITCATHLNARGELQTLNCLPRVHTLCNRLPGTRAVVAVLCSVSGVDLSSRLQFVEAQQACVHAPVRCRYCAGDQVVVVKAG